MMMNETEHPDIRATCEQLKNEDQNVINIRNYNSYKNVRITCKELSTERMISFRGIQINLTSENFSETENLWILECQKYMTDWKIKSKRLGPVMKDGIIMVGQI